MAISTRWSRSPVTRPAHSPSIMARPSSSRPSSVKNPMAASMSSSTIPTLSKRLTVMMSPRRLTSAFCRAALSAKRREVGVGQQRAVRRQQPLKQTNQKEACPNNNKKCRVISPRDGKVRAERLRNDFGADKDNEAQRKRQDKHPD